MGFSLIYTTSGVFHIAHGAVYTAAAYAIYCFFVILEFPLAPAIVLALLSTSLLGALTEIAIYRPLHKREASSAVLMISSLGAYIVIVNLLSIQFGNETKILRSGIENTISFGYFILTRVQIAQMVVAIFVVALYWLFLRKTSMGRICRSLADDSILASVLGVEVERTRLFVFTLGSFLAAIGAVLVALDVGFDPRVGFPAVLVAAVACIVGGLHRFMAAALGGILIGVIQTLVVWQISAKWESAVTFVLLLGFLLLRPQGLMGIRKRVEEK